MYLCYFKLLRNINNFIEFLDTDTINVPLKILLFASGGLLQDLGPIFRSVLISPVIMIVESSDKFHIKAKVVLIKICLDHFIVKIIGGPWRGQMFRLKTDFLAAHKFFTNLQTKNFSLYTDIKNHPN